MVWGATQKYTENFDDQSLADTGITAKVVLRNMDTGSGGNPSAGQYSWGTGHGSGISDGSGYSVGSGTINAIYVEWGGYYGGGASVGEWSSDELYLSYWMKYPSYVHRESDNDNIKFFYPQFGSNSNDDKWEAYMVNGTGCGMAFYHDGALLTYNDGNTRYYGGNFALSGPYGYAADGGWHHYEFYIKFSTCEFKFWFDRQEGDYTTEASLPIGQYGLGTTGTYLLLNQDIPNVSWDDNVIILTWGSIDGEEANTFTRFFDDIEVWDGMPDSTPAPAPPTLSNVTISGGSFR